MVETNRAEESPIKKMDSKRIKEIQQETAHSESVSVQQALLKVWNECAQQSQSEIDELTKEKSLFIEKYTKSCNEVQKLEKVNDELTKDKELLDLKLNALDKLFKEQTKEVERLRKGIDWTRAEYIKCVNDSDEITEKLEELLTTP